MQSLSSNRKWAHSIDLGYVKKSHRPLNPLACSGPLNPGYYSGCIMRAGRGRKPRGDTAPFLLRFNHCCYYGFSLSHPAWRWPKGVNIVGYFRINDNIINNIFSSFVSVLGIESRMLLLPGKGYCKWAACPDLALSQRLTNHFTGLGIKVSFPKYQCSSCTDRAGERQVQGQCWTTMHATAQRQAARPDT